MFSAQKVFFLVLYHAFVIEFFPSVDCQKTNKTHCETRDLRIPTGTHHLDLKNCTIYYCRETHIRHAEIDFYICRGIDKILFDDLYQDCFDNNCDTGEFLHHKVKKIRNQVRSKKKENQQKKSVTSFV